HVWKYYEELVRGEREHYSVEKPYYRNDGTVLSGERALRPGLAAGPGCGRPTSGHDGPGTAL
ncbi:hypothetical protein AB0K87_31640, partial [Streptomyces sp. NPDC053705]|uniref:hypothetical protein n=1 Tax=Streptomyces sp. NPDC053705 TaxID=3156668 RepID=UPI003443E530